MQQIIEPISKELLLSELSRDKFLRKTNKNNKEIYIINADNSPNVMKEIGRIRELTFRLAGAGTGKELDIDKFDIEENPYQQLIVWDKEEKEILGGYRFLVCKNKNIEALASSRLFHFSEDFKKNYFPYTIELGRSFIQPKFQTTANLRASLFTLDNLWDGLGALIVNYPDMKYFIGKVTMYKHFNNEARNLILSFLSKYFKDIDKLVYPKTPLSIENLESFFIKNNYKEDYKILSKKVRELNENIPPLINSYMSLSKSMKVFGTCYNKYFGNVEETGIMITVNDIYPHKKERNINSYISEKKF